MDRYKYKPLIKKTVNLLILVNLVCFVFFNLFTFIRWFSVFGLVPRFLFGKLQIWRLFTYMFVHAGFWHFLVNMLMLWFFGSSLEALWGKKKFLVFYFFTGVGAGLCSALLQVNSLVPVVGASGAIFGILVAFTIIYPDTEVLLFFIFPVKMRYAVLLFIGMNLMGAFSSPGGEIAYIAHLGGGLFGYIYMKSRTIQSFLDPDFLRHRIEEKKESYKQKKKEDINQKVDRILDKISKEGAGSLTQQEKEILKRKAQG